MVLVTTSWQRWAAGLAVSLVVFLVLYLTVIQPSTNTANQAVKAGVQQTQQAIKQAQQQINAGTNQAKAASGQAAAVGAKANKQLAAAGAKANKQLSVAGKLAACVAAAGTDTGKLQACQVKYTP
jgi:F0F1-type ATP synthase membrane subunit b/b'